MKNYPLDRNIKLVLWLMSLLPIPSEAGSQQFRARADASPPAFLYRRFAGVTVENRAIPGRQGQISVRIYRPSSAGSRALVVFFHGGGFVFGGLESHHQICQRVAGENGACVVAVDYRLAPAHKYPAAVEDAYDAFCWAAEHAAELGADPTRLTVMGDSAGGNLAAVVSLMARDLSGPRPALQVLLYPALDLGGEYPSKGQYDDIPVLNRKAINFYRDAYIRQPADLQEAYLSPLLAPDLGNLPPALVLSAEFDALRDEARAYADRLAAAGNKVCYVCCAGMPHGFLSFGRMASGAEPAYERIRQAFAQFPLLVH